MLYYLSLCTVIVDMKNTTKNAAMSAAGTFGESKTPLACEFSEIYHNLLVLSGELIVCRYIEQQLMQDVSAMQAFVHCVQSFVCSWQRPTWPTCILTSTQCPASVVIDSSTHLLTIILPDIENVATSLYNIIICPGSLNMLAVLAHLPTLDNRYVHMNCIQLQQCVVSSFDSCNWWCSLIISCFFMFYR